MRIKNLQVFNSWQPPTPRRACSATPTAEADYEVIRPCLQGTQISVSLPKGLRVFPRASALNVKYRNRQMCQKQLKSGGEYAVFVKIMLMTAGYVVKCDSALFLQPTLTHELRDFLTNPSSSTEINQGLVSPAPPSTALTFKSISKAYDISK